MITIRKLTVLGTATLAASMLSTAALAHTGAGATSSFIAGFSHPVGGLDHVLAMVGVGLFAWMLKGRALWLVPASFVAMMAAGGILGAFALPVPMVELGIALSIVAIGALVALGRSLPLASAMAIVGVFAIFHGHAHGGEMPAAISGLAYGFGFMVATTLLHGLGLLAGFAAGKASEAHGVSPARAGGAAMALAGMVLIGAVL